MKKRLLSFICFFVLLGLAGCNRGDRKIFRVLVLHSYQEECSWMADMNRGISDAFDAAGLRVEPVFRYLHSNYDKKRCCDTVTAWLNRMERPDLILAVNDQATAALLSANHPHTEKANGCPVVFCGIDYPDSLSLDGHPNFSGFTTPVNPEKTFRLASVFRLNKGKMFLKQNNLCQTAVSEIEKQNKASNYPYPLEADSLDRQSYHDTYYSLVLYKSRCFNLLPEWDCYLSEFIHSSAVPFLALGNEGFGDGYLGGYFTPSYDLAYDGASEAAGILQNRSAETTVLKESESYLMVDWEVLNRFDLPLWKLPPEARIIHMPFTLKYEKQLVVLAVFGAVFITLLAVFFIYKVIRYKQEQKELEIRARQEHDGLQVVTDSISAGIISIGSNGTVLSLNAEARRQLGLGGEEGEYTGKLLYELIEIVDVNVSHGLRKLLDQVLGNKQTVRLPPMATLQCKLSGKYFMVEGEFTPLLDNTYFNGAVFCFTDRTDEFATQEFLTLTSTLGQLFFWWYDFNSGYLVIDPGFFAYFNLPDDGTHQLLLVDFLKALNKEDWEQWKAAYDRQRFSQDIKSVLEARLSLGDKQEEWWEIRLVYQSNRDVEAPPSLFGLCINIEDFKEKQKLLEEARENVHRSEQLKSAFLSNMSHEIRTPLNGIIGFAKLIADSDEYDPEEHKMFVETIQTNSNLLLALINDILDLARIDSGSMTYSDIRFNLSKLIVQIVTTQQVILQKPLQFITRLPEEPAFIQVDQLRLNQVITNLVNNAVKFTDTGSITVGYTADADSLRITVADTGIGIAEEELEHIFDRFFKKYNDIQGAGIGLNLCKNIVEHYGGSITVASRLGEGTVFTVVLPCNADAENNVII